MTTPTVNEQFTAERMRQLDSAADRKAWIEGEVAAGRARNLGNGQYRITEGWDANETIQLTETGEIIAQHGLDTTTGQVALYTRVPAWHSLGTVIPEGLSDIDLVLQAAGLDYLVEKRPIPYRNPVTGEWEVHPNEFLTHRMDTGRSLGIVGNIFEPLQNRRGFEFLEALVGRFGVRWESAGALRDGARTFVSLKLENEICIDPNGVADLIDPHIVALNSHDGTGKFEVVATPWRPECGNTERLAVRDALVRWGTRHTTNAKDKVAEAQHTFANSMTYFEKFVEEQEALARTPMVIDEFHKVIEEIWGEVDEDATKKAQTARKNLLETLDELHGRNTAKLGHTAYAAERALTEWADWKRQVKPRSESLRGNNLAARATAMIEGTTDDVKTRVHRQLMLRTR